MAYENMFLKLFSLIVLPRVALTGSIYGDIIDYMLSESRYENKVRPYFYEKKPLNITTRLIVIAADDINVNAMDFKLELRLAMTWQDYRLKHNHSHYLMLGGDLTHRVWIPDVYVVNAKEINGHKTTEDNEIMIIYNNGTVYYSLRLSIRASCHVDLHMFPWDTQKCSLIIQSYSWASNDIRFFWHDDGQQGASYVQSLKERPMAQYDLNEFILRAEQLRNFQDGSDENLWSSLEALFSFRRLNGFYLIQILAPSNFLVILSWVSFLINPDHAPARVFLGTSCVLTMAAIQNYINMSLPKVSYIKIIDVYSLSCYFFVVLVMAEYALVLLLNDRVRKEKIFKEENKIPTVTNKRIQRISSFCKFWPQLKLCIYGNPFCMHIPVHAGRTVDKTCIILFPVVYIIFNIGFWTHVGTSIDEVNIESTKEFFL